MMVNCRLFGSLVTAAVASCYVLAVPHAGPKAATSRATAIVDLSAQSDRALLVGGWDGRRWVRDEAYHRTLRGGEQYQFYDLAAKVAVAKGGKPKLSEASGSAYLIDVKSLGSSHRDLIGISGRWNVLPRKPREVAANAPEYRAAVAAALWAKGLSGAPVNVTKVLRVDLQGHGSEQALISATCPRLLRKDGEALMQPQRGDYSFVMLRTARDGTVRTSLLEGQFFTQANARETVNIYEIGGALDLNGDGIMEPIVRWRYYEGYGVDVFETKRGVPQRVLAASEGA